MSTSPEKPKENVLRHKERSAKQTTHIFFIFLKKLPEAGKKLKKKHYHHFSPRMATSIPLFGYLGRFFEYTEYPESHLVLWG
jgi:hypothetical protein